MRMTFGLLLTAALACSAQAQTGRSVMDSAGRTVAVPERAARIFPAGPPAAIVIYTLAPDAMIGWTRKPSPQEAAWLPEAYAKLPGYGRLTGRGNEANLELVLSVKPDVLVDVGTIGPTYVSLADRVQEQTKLPYLLFDGTLAAFPETYRRLGAALGVAERGEMLAREIETMLKGVTEKIATLAPEKRPRVYFARGQTGLETALSGSINAAVLDYVNVRNVAGEALGAGGLANVSLEQVIAWNPDAIITGDVTFFAKVKSDPLWSGLTAVRAGRVYLTPQYPFPWIDFPPSVNMVLGVRWAAKTLYPDLFPEDLSPVARRFFELFYHRAPSEAEMKTLLEPSRG